MILALWLFCLCGVSFASASIDISEDIDGKIRRGFFYKDIVKHLSNGGEERWIKQHFGKNSKITWIDENTKPFQEYKIYFENGLTAKGITFNIYDDGIRNEAIIFFKLLNSLDLESFHVTVAWASINVNSGILEYALRLVTHYNENFKDLKLPPPFVVRPNFFFNSEAIRKAYILKLRHGIFVAKESKVNHYYRMNDTVIINTNYSGWNLPGNGCSEKLKYFREDIGLNSFYYGVHLDNPFWMSNDELEKINPRQIDQYHYIHQQLLARYLLEAEANNMLLDEVTDLKPSCNYPFYNPYLEYENGLSFPLRLLYNPKVDVQSASYLASIDTIIKELAARGLAIVKIYESSLNMTEESFMETVSKIIRANIDGVKYAKILRSMYGANGYPVDEYNPSPSVMHHPETSLRDPLYWSLISYATDYFQMFKKALPAHNMSLYETKDLKLSIKRVSKLVTYFESYQTDITNIISDKNEKNHHRHLMFTARQKRLAHSPFTIEMHIDAMFEKDTIIRIFIGPRCSVDDCFKQFDRWYELDTFPVTVKEGSNGIIWNSERSKKFSKDETCNIENYENNENVDAREKSDKCSKEYDFFKFPERLLLPKGSTEGFEASLFIMVTENTEDLDLIKGKLLPLGFPFDHYLINYNPDAYNYQMIEVTIYHSGQDIDDFEFEST